MNCCEYEGLCGVQLVRYLFCMMNRKKILSQSGREFSLYSVGQPSG